MSKRISLKKQTAFIFLSKYASVLTNIVTYSILSRILSPNEFGIVAVISTFIAFFNIIADIGIGSAVIQNRELDQDDINMLFTITLYFGILLDVIFIILSVFIAKLYSNVIYIPIGVILSLALLFNTANTIPNAILMKEERFFAVGFRTIVSNLFSGTIAIIFALKGAGCYTLAMQTVCTSVIIFGWNYWYTRLRVIKGIDFSCVNKVRDFSVYWFGFNVLNYFARNFDNIITGMILGETALGYYNKAYQLMLYPVQNLTYVLNPILHPVLAKHQDNVKLIYTKYVKMLKILSLIGIYISAFCLFNAKEIVTVAFGDQWERSISVFEILSISIWFQITNSSTGAIYASTNRTNVLLKSGMIYIPIQVILFCIAASKKKIELMAVAVSMGMILKFFVDYIVLIKRVFKTSFLDFLKNFKMEPILFAISYVSMTWGRCVNIENDVFLLIYNLIISGGVFGAALVLTGEIRHLYNFINSKGYNNE